MTDIDDDFLTSLQNEVTPVHMLLLSFTGCAFALIMGSFFGYHVYLVMYVLSGNSQQQR